MQMADQQWNGEALTSWRVSVALTLVCECQQEFIPLPGLCTGGGEWVQRQALANEKGTLRRHIYKHTHRLTCYSV